MMTLSISQLQMILAAAPGLAVLLLSPSLTVLRADAVRQNVAPAAHFSRAQARPETAYQRIGAVQVASIAAPGTSPSPAAGSAATYSETENEFAASQQTVVCAPCRAP